MIPPGRAAMELETPRLRLRRFTLDDASFVLRVLNEPGFLRHVGDKKVHNVEEAKRYLALGPISSCERFGHGILRVERREDGVALGMCGVIRRDTLPEPDLGYAFLAEHAGRGYAREAAAACIADARERLRLPRLLAIITPDNARSIRLVEALGFRFDGVLRLPGDEATLRRYVLDLGRGRHEPTPDPMGAAS